MRAARRAAGAGLLPPGAAADRGARVSAPQHRRRSRPLLQPRPWPLPGAARRTGAALHPALRPARTARARRRRARVLFLCTGNSARSQMAEALAEAARRDGAIARRQRRQPPQAATPRGGARDGARGVDLAGHRPSTIGEFAGRRFDYVVSLCDRVREVCPEFPGPPRLVHWSIPDPAREPATAPAAPSSGPQTSSPTRIRFLLDPDHPSEEVLSTADELVNVRYMVDDVDGADRLLHHPFRLRARHAAPRPRSPTSARGHLRLLLSGPTSSAGRPMPDGRRPAPGGWNRIHLLVDDIARRGRAAARRRADVPQRHRHRPRRPADPARRPSRATRSSSSSPPAHRGPPGPPRSPAADWGRIGCIGFGGPPTHIALLRELCVERRRWLDAHEFEDAVAACNLLPGPASTQLAIYCAWRVRGRAGALVGGAAFIVPGLVLILALAVLFLAGSPPTWVRGAGAGAGAAVAAVAVQAGASLVPASWRRARKRAAGGWVAISLAGAVAAATVGPWLVLVLLGCGAVELVAQRGRAPTLAADADAARGGRAAAPAGCSRWPGSPSRSARCPTAAAS